MIQDLRYDLRHWGVGTAWFNLRFNLALHIARLLIRRDIRLTAKDVDR